jgi:hypothetical protein
MVRDLATVRLLSWSEGVHILFGEKKRIPVLSHGCESGLVILWIDASDELMFLCSEISNVPL